MPSKKPCLRLLRAAFATVVTAGAVRRTAGARPGLRLNDREYFTMPGLDVMVFQDIYPEEHQRGVGIIQNGVRVASNGDVCLERTLGPWQPVPVQGVANGRQEELRDRGDAGLPGSVEASNGLQPDRVSRSEAHLQAPRPPRRRFGARHGGSRRAAPESVGRPGRINLELFPGALFGENWYVDQKAGSFPRRPNGPVRLSGPGHPRAPMLNALNFILECHPGESTASFASGVGIR
jgi:endoglucanase